MKRTKNLTFRDLELIVYLYWNNVRIGDIAKRFNKNPSSIHRTIEKARAKRKPQKTLEEWEKEFYDRLTS